MLVNIIGQQQVFLKDYKAAASESKETDEELLEKVIQHLNLSGQNSFKLSADETKSGKSVVFPFEKQLQSRDYDGAINAEYTYIGEPFEEEDKMDEQQEW